jgi:hypothetical protein
VEEVLVSRPGLGLRLGDGDALGGGVLKESSAASEALVEDGKTPGSNDLDGGVKTVEGKLEADLVVTLTGAAVRDEA